MKAYIDKWAKMISESYDDNSCEINQFNENNDIEGRRYDWKPDFQFTDEVVSDLKKRNLLELGNYIQVLVPINRDDAPNYYHAGDGVVDDDGKHLYNGKEAARHDLEPYDILHIQLNFDMQNKSIGIDRYYGHRKDWCGENHTSTHRDWSAVPPLTRSTVDSIINTYKDHGVFEGLLKAIDDYVDKSVASDVHWYGGPKSRIYSTSNDEFDFMDKREMYKQKSQDPRFLKWLQRYIDRYQNSNYVKKLRQFCEEVQSGNIFKYEYNFFEPEIPSDEYQKQKFEEHSQIEKHINSELSEYYSSHSYTGD